MDFDCEVGGMGCLNESFRKSYDENVFSDNVQWSCKKLWKISAADGEGRRVSIQVFSVNIAKNVRVTFL